MSIFLDTAGEMSERYDFDIFAYVLMDNHYHLLGRSRQANLKKAMQWFGTTYTRRFNLRHFRSGHLFQGRYKRASFNQLNSQFKLLPQTIRQGNKMAYKENIGSCIAKFDQSVKKSGLPIDTERKLLSILRSLEYQVEIGVCPVPVALHLKEAMLAWIEVSGNKHKSLSTDLNKCVDVVLNEIGGAEPGA